MNDLSRHYLNRQLCDQLFPIQYPDSWYDFVTSGHLRTVAIFHEGIMVAIIICELKKRFQVIRSQPDDGFHEYKPWPGRDFSKWFYANVYKQNYSLNNLCLWITGLFRITTDKRSNRHNPEKGHCLIGIIMILRLIGIWKKKCCLLDGNLVPEIEKKRMENWFFGVM